MTELELRAGLLAKTVWTNQDIMNYLGCHKTKASVIRQIAIKKHSGHIEILPKMVRRDAVLEAIGTNVTIEIMNIKDLRS